MRRFNRSVFDYVQEAIKLADQGKAYEAALMCKENDVPLEVARRVITRPDQRRSRSRSLFPNKETNPT